MTSSYLQTGAYGETVASDLLTKKGYRIREKNFRTRFGEIDLIAEKDGTIAFVEVKSRIGISKGKPYEAVTQHKLSTIMRTGQLYVLQKGLNKYKLSVHVISIVFDEAKKVQSLRHFENITL